jgi:hypothetical protein
MSFLDNYEDVAARIRRLHETYPDNKVHTSIVEFNADKGYILVECRIYRHYEDQEPAGIDYAFGRVESYNVQMKRFFVEDTTTSAIGRCAGLVLGSQNRATLQNMQQVEVLPKAFAEKSEVDLWATSISEDLVPASSAIEQIKEKLGGVQVAAAPICPHGHMIWRSGDKAGKAWGGYMCVEKTKAKQCSPRWFVLASDGQWKPQV